MVMTSAGMMAPEDFDSSLHKLQDNDVGSEGSATATPSDGSASVSPRSNSGSQSDASSMSEVAKCKGFTPEGFTLNAALAVRIVEILGVRLESTLSDALAQPVGSPTYAAGFSVRLVQRCLRLLQASHYSQDDIEVIVAHAICYVEKLKVVSRKEGAANVPIADASYVFCVLVFLAQAHTQDQNRPLKVWHRYLFRNYCELKVLNCAVMGLMEKLGYSLRIRPRRLQLQLSSLLLGCRTDCRRVCDNPVALP